MCCQEDSHFTSQRRQVRTFYGGPRLEYCPAVRGAPPSKRGGVYGVAVDSLKGRTAPQRELKGQIADVSGLWAHAIGWAEGGMKPVGLALRARRSAARCRGQGKAVQNARQEPLQALNALLNSRVDIDLHAQP